MSASCSSRRSTRPTTRSHGFHSTTDPDSASRGSGLASPAIGPRGPVSKKTDSVYLRGQCVGWVDHNSLRPLSRKPPSCPGSPALTIWGPASHWRDHRPEDCLTDSVRLTSCTPTDGQLGEALLAQGPSSNLSGGHLTRLSKGRFTLVRGRTPEHATLRARSVSNCWSPEYGRRRGGGTYTTDRDCFGGSSSSGWRGARRLPGTPWISRALRGDTAFMHAVSIINALLPVGCLGSIRTQRR